MPTPKDLIHVISTTTGTGDMTVSAVIRNFSDSDAFGTGTTTDVFDYFGWNDGAPGEWEHGTGHMSATNTLVRDTIKASSNGGAAVSWSAGTKHFANDVPAAKQVRNEGSAPADGDFAVFDGVSGGKIKGAGVGRKGPTVQVFTSSGTWTKPTGCVKIKATIIGPGGNGGNAPATSSTNNSTAGGGGGGGWSILYKDVTAVSSIAVTIGANGGGTTSFDIASATGGANGPTLGPTTAAGYAAVCGASGAGSGGDINGSGWLGPAGTLTSGSSQCSGSGGSSILGGGKPGGLASGQRNGQNATTPGAGGEGSSNSTSQTAATGGNGAPGCVIVEEYYA